MDFWWLVGGFTKKGRMTSLPRVLGGAGGALGQVS